MESLHNFTSCRPGHKHKGLSNVKNYFHRFGYIPSMPPSNFTDDFDDTLVAAIQTYQKNYHLNITGVLDDSTVRQMALPRCGVPDVIHNRSIATSFGNKTAHVHTVSHYGFFNGMPRWPAGTQQLTYAFLPANNLNLTSDYKAAIARAFDRWTPVVKIAFQETASYETANIKVAFLRGDHGDGFPFDGPLAGSSRSTLAHAFAPTDGRCHFDADEVWVASGDVKQSTVPTAVDLESVAVHEIGHLLGLDHSFDQTAIMYATMPLQTRKVELAEDDKQGIRVLYQIN